MSKQKIIWVIEQWMPSPNPGHDGPGDWLMRDDLVFHDQFGAEHYMGLAAKLDCEKNNKLKVVRYKRMRG